MMKRLIALLMAMLLAFAACTAIAQEGDLRHQVKGDVSQFVVDDKAGESRNDPEKEPATIGTDAYLFVDPDTASDVTFYVTDEDGNPIRGAQIYIIYNGISQLYGVTDEDGECSMYLFRNVTYGYKVVKAGYESAEGHFTATQATKRVHVVLRRLHTLTVIVVDNGTPVPGAQVSIDGKAYVTDAQGRVQVPCTNGEYSITVTAPDGRKISLKAVVNGDTTVVVDIGLDDGLVAGGRYHDRFLVYNHSYQPEDYVLTEYHFSAEDLTRASDETEQDFAQRVERYLSQTANTLLIEAQPERRQYDNAPDQDILGTDGQKLYAQRSLMPMGSLLRAYEDRGFEKLVFTNENFGLQLDMADLYTGGMAKVYAVLNTLVSRSARIRDIVSEECRSAYRGLEKTGLTQVTRSSFDLSKLDMTAVRDFRFAYTAGQGDADVLPDSLFTQTLFEFRVTPIRAEEIRQMIRDGLTRKAEMEQDTVLLASTGYFRRELSKWQADGRLTDAECKELYAYVADGRLTSQDLADLQRKQAAGTLRADEIDLLYQAAMDAKLYRVSCWLLYDDIQVEITAQLPSLTWLWKADAQYEDAYQAQLQQLCQQQPNRDAAALEAAHAAELDTAAQQALLQAYGFLTIAQDGAKPQKPGEKTALHGAALIRSLPAADAEFYETLAAKPFRQIVADVRRESTLLNGKQTPWYRAYLTEGTALLELHRALTMDAQATALVGLTKQ